MFIRSRVLKVVQVDLKFLHPSSTLLSPSLALRFECLLSVRFLGHKDIQDMEVKI